MSEKESALTRLRRKLSDGLYDLKLFLRKKFNIPERKTSISRRNRSRRIFIAGMLSVGLIQFAVFWVYVNFNSILMAFQQNTRAGTVWSFKNFERFFHEFARPQFELSLALKNSLLLFLVGTLMSLALSLLFAYYLYKKVRWSGFYRVVFFLPSIISAAVLVALFKYIVAGNGPLNELLSIIAGYKVDIEWVIDEQFSMMTILFYCLWTGFGSNIVLLTSAIYRVPADLTEYAKIDGVGMTRELFQLIIPLIWPTLSTLLVFATAGLFTNMGPVLLFTQGQFKTMTLGYFIFDKVTGHQYEYPAAIGLIFTAIGLPLVLGVRWLLGKVYEDVSY